MCSVSFVLGKICVSVVSSVRKFPTHRLRNLLTAKRKANVCRDVAGAAFVFAPKERVVVFVLEEIGLENH